MIALAPASSARKSHLAFALLWLPAPRRRDALVFFRFCRTVDDIADEPGRTDNEKRRLLDEWLEAITGDRLPEALVGVVRRNGIERTLLAEIVRGCAMDIRPARYQTFDDLEKYCWRVACAVGLVSIRIFGCGDPRSTGYAENLGHALQLTNILRDVREDAAMGRIYLPLDDLARFGVGEQEILEGRPGEERFRDLMRFEAARARARFHAAIPPAPDARALVPAEIMKAIYAKILTRIENAPDFARRIRLGHLEKLAVALRVCLRPKPGS
ncbi:MAG: squalene/phytoene synthase family protein [Verrucomicrobiae bacterium]